MKIKRSYNDVLGVALALVDLLRPACERIEIAGSLRRECREVGDIELVAIPKMRTVAADLFSVKEESCLDDLLYALEIKLSKNGPRMKQFTCDGFQVDLFLADHANYGYILAIRTGPAEFSRLMVTRQPYGLQPPTVNVRDGYVYSYPANERLAVPDEETLFRLWGLESIAPIYRKVSKP